MKMTTGWLALAFFVVVSTIGVGTWYYQSHMKNSTNGTSVLKAEKKQRAEKPVEKPAEMPIEKEEGYVATGSPGITFNP